MDTNAEPFSTVHETGEPLINVQGFFFVDEPSDDMLVAVQFEFENHVVVLAAQDDDTLQVIESSRHIDEVRVDSRNLSKLSPWNRALGKPLLWSWRMTNQQGYSDGVQLQFATNVTGEKAEVQLIVVASEIKVKEL